VTQRTALRWLAEHVDRGRIVKQGQKKGARYKIANPHGADLKVA
jgi:hypothetical protein